MIHSDSVHEGQRSVAKSKRVVFPQLHEILCLVHSS